MELLFVISSEFDVKRILCNSLEILDTGVISTLIDVVGSMAIVTNDPLGRKMITINLQSTFIQHCFVNEQIFIKSITEKIDKNIAFSKTEMYNKRGDICYKGNTVMNLIDESHPFI